MAEYCSPCIPTILSGQKRLRKVWSGQVRKMFPRPVKPLPKRVIKPVLAKWLDLWSAANWSFSAAGISVRCPAFLKDWRDRRAGLGPATETHFVEETCQTIIRSEERRVGKECRYRWSKD